MADGFIQPCKGRVRSCMLKGVDLTQYVNVVRVYENIKKPYLTGQLVILDNNNLLENMGIVGGESCSVVFDSPPGDRTYSAALNLLSMKGQQSPNNLKTQIYTIELIGLPYFQDKANMVQKAFGNVTGTGAIQQIWNQYLGGDTLQILAASAGMIGKQNDPSTIENKKPFDAIDQIKKMLAGGPYSTGVPLLFRDRDNVKLGPLQTLYSNLSAQESYVQKETWGADFFDPLIYNSIIVAQAEVEQGEGGRSSTQDIAATVNQSQIVFDMFKGSIASNKAGAGITGGTFGSGSKSIGSLITSVAGNVMGLSPGSLGGAPNVQVTQSNRWERANAPDTKTMGERRYAAEARGGPQLRIKVPMQTGLNATVGKGVQCTLIPPVGDLTNFNVHSYGMSGLWLVRELCHEVYTDNREVQATTSMHLMRGGLG